MKKPGKRQALLDSTPALFSVTQDHCQDDDGQNTDVAADLESLRAVQQLFPAVKPSGFNSVEVGDVAFGGDYRSSHHKMPKITSPAITEPPIISVGRMNFHPPMVTAISFDITLSFFADLNHNPKII